MLALELLLALSCGALASTSQIEVLKETVKGMHLCFFASTVIKWNCSDIALETRRSGLENNWGNSKSVIVPKSAKDI